MSLRKFESAGLWLVITAMALLSTGVSRAQGFSVYEHGTCTMATAGATVADPCDDGSAIYFNPAGVAGQPGVTVSGGAVVIAAFGSYTHDANGNETELQNDPIVVPHLYLTGAINDKLSAGLGVYVPYGLGTLWPSDNFEGRFLGYDNTLQSVYIQPTMAYRVTDKLSVGAGLTYVIASIELNRRVDLSTQPVPSPAVPPGTTFRALGVPTGYDFADANMTANGATGIGGNFGVQFQLTDGIDIGARYMLPVKLEYEGDATFTSVTPANPILLPAQNPFGVPAGTSIHTVIEGSGIFTQGALRPQDVRTEITMPAQFVAGLAFDATSQLKVLVDYQWTGWSTFKEIELDFSVLPDQTQHENYKDTHALRIGADYALNNQWNLRLGALAHTAAAPDETVTPLLPEAGRTEFTAGFGWKLTPGVELNAAYQFLNQKDREGRVSDSPNGDQPTTELNSGMYSFGAHLFATTLTVRL